MHGLGGGRQVVVARLALPRRGGLGRGRRDQRRAAGGQGGRAAGRDEGALEEAAPLGVELVEQLLTMELEFRAIAIVACAHRGVLRLW